MEPILSLPNTTLTTAFFITSALVLFLVHFLKRKSSSNKLAPPQAKGAWPIIGHLHLLGGSKPAHFVLGDMADKYGDIFTIKLGVHQALIVSSADTAKECFTTNDKVFASRPKAKAVEIMGYNYAIVGLAPYGDYWRQIRKIIMLEILSNKRVEMLQHVRVSELEYSTKDIYDAWVMNKNKSEKVKLDMKHWFGNLVLNDVVRITSGKRYPLSDEEGIQFEKTILHFFELIGAFVPSDYIPVNWFDRHAKEMKMIAEEMNTFIDGWLQDRKNRKQEPGEHQYFMDVLISVLKDANKDDYAGFDHDIVIKATCMTILAAGFDTTAATLTWALSLLLNNPKALKAIQEELDEHIGRDRLVEESDLKKLVYLDAVIKETMRLYPAGPLAMPHEAMEDCTVSGYHIPKGTRLLANIWKLQHDPKLWHQPDEFIPERFLTTHKDMDVRGNHFGLIPFGSGRRICPAITFAMHSMALTLATLIQRFVIERPSDEPINMTVMPGLTTSRATPLDVLLAPRLSTDIYYPVAE